MLKYSDDNQPIVTEELVDDLIKACENNKIKPEVATGLITDVVRAFVKMLELLPANGLTFEQNWKQGRLKGQVEPPLLLVHRDREAVEVLGVNLDYRPWEDDESQDPHQLVEELFELLVSEKLTLQRVTFDVESEEEQVRIAGRLGDLGFHVGESFTSYPAK